MQQNQFPDFMDLNQKGRIYRQETNNCSSIFMLIVIIVITIMITKQSIRVPSNIVSTMKAFIMARNTTTSESETKHDAHFDISDSLIKKSNVVNLTHCDPNDESCKILGKIDSDVLKKNDEKVQSFLNENPDSLIMVYAPWCQHCHRAMPEFIAASNESSLPFALINGELVSSHLVHGKDCLIDVQYYPFIFRRCKIDGKIEDTMLENAPTKQNILEKAKKDNLSMFF